MILDSFWTDFYHADLVLIWLVCAVWLGLTAERLYKR